ncbi:hypothetical protein [Streptomyces prunicolor]|uniref:hypothetical protein n=1 Tax=Streptomyces prunicolor TaxID=67348 RepID=UPI0033D7FA10
MTQYISAPEAADWLGTSTVGVYAALDKAQIRNQTIDPNGNKSFLLSEVADEAGRRASEAFRRSGHQTLEEMATKVRDTLRPPAPKTYTLSDGSKIPRDPDAALRDVKIPRGRDALAFVDRDAKTVFGAHVLNAAVATVPAGSCRWHLANSFRPMGSRPLTISKPLEILLGAPCLGCRTDGTPAKRQTARTAGAGRPVARSVTEAMKWRQIAAQRLAAGNVTGPHSAASAEANALVWLRSGRGQR